MITPKGLRAKSIFFLQLSNVLFAVTAIFISLLSSQFDGYFTSFCRFLVGTALGLGQLALTKKPFHIVRFKPWIGRGVFGAIGMVLYYVAIALGTPGRASLLNNTYPIFVAIIAILIMRDKVKPLTVIGLLLSFIGVALVLWDGAKVSLMADLIGLSSGVVAAVSYHFNKKASQTEDPIVIYLGVCLIGLVATAFSVPQALRLNWASAALLLLAGAGGYFAQIAITIGLRDIDTTEGSVHTFIKIPLTVIAGWLVLSDPITSRFILGTALLLVGLLLDQIIALVSRQVKRG
jgi:drug/metabolite transporter (DMT)-like permease